MKQRYLLPISLGPYKTILEQPQKRRSEMYAVQSMSSASSKVSCVIKVVQTEGMKEFLVWPDTPKRRQMERQP